MNGVVTRLARAMALVGGLALLALVVLTCSSIVGRLLNGIGHSATLRGMSDTLAGALQQLGPINGDFELVEAGVAFAVFAFFPWCQLQRGHATVDVFTNRLGARARAVLQRLWDGVFALTLALITWRLVLGMLDKRRYGETTLMLEFPVWWGFAACAVASFLAAVVAVYVTITGPADQGKRA